MKLSSSLTAWLSGGITLVHALKYTPELQPWNLNTNQTATNVLDYSSSWDGHVYTASPDNWRFPIYTVILDKWLNGNPANDNINNTVYEFDFYETGLRNGGDIQGLEDSLDYLLGMGIKVMSISLGAQLVLIVPSVSMSLVRLTGINLGKPINTHLSITLHSILMEGPSRSGEMSSLPCTNEECTSCSISQSPLWPIL